MNFKRLSATLGLSLAVVPTALSAQAQAAQCTIATDKPGQVKDANNALAKAALFAGKPDQVIAATKDAFAKLAKDEAKVIAANPAGRALVMGQAYVELATTVPGGLGTAVSRAAAGLVGDGNIDLLATADSLLDIADKEAGCNEATEETRRKPYGLVANEAVNLYNAQQTDSALKLADRGLTIYDGYKLSYIAYSIKGNVQQGKDDLNAAAKTFIRMTEVMKGHDDIAEERKGMMVNISNMLLGHSEMLEGAEKTAKLGEAQTLLKSYLSEFPGDARAQATLARAQLMSGDSAGAKGFFSEMAASPDKYSEAQLFDAGANAARSGMAKEAVAIFDAGLKKNPYGRDGLYNIAITLQGMDRYSEAEGYARRLIAIDPENRDAYQIMALNYQGGNKSIKTTIDSLRKVALDAANDKKTTTAQKNAIAARVRGELEPKEAEQKVLNDSLLTYFNRFQNAKGKIAFSLWAHDGAKHVLAGGVDNLGDAPADYTIKFEFMDVAGKVITTKDVQLTGVAAKGNKTFRLEIDGDGIVAFKYAPFTGS